MIYWKQKGDEIVTRSERYAIDAAKEIVIAKMSNSSLVANKENGENVAEFFESIYKKIVELAKPMD